VQGIQGRGLVARLPGQTHPILAISMDNLKEATSRRRAAPKSKGPAKKAA
jgi:hypothetical protein